MKLHVFNPEHDIALAHDDQYFTAPKVARMLREGCGFLPALWAVKMIVFSLVMWSQLKKNFEWHVWK